MRKELAKQEVITKGVRIRLACKAFSISESCYRYEAINDNENALIADYLLRLTDTHKR